MSGLAYIERAVSEHPVARQILARMRADSVIEIERYGEVFNPKSQNFRLQKKNPALIVAEKHGKKVLATPAGYGIGGNRNYYFSHMMNCIYDCRYCFLQGMYQSANHVVFANYADFFAEITQTSREHSTEPVWFFSGYDCDSLALEPVTKFMAHCLDFFSGDAGELSEQRAPSNAYLEIRTKSTQIRSLLERPPVKNCVVAYSLSPEAIVKDIEHKTPSLEKRIQALKKLQSHGWSVGLRFDPLIACENFEDLYSSLFDDVFAALDTDAIHSVSLGTFRLPKPFYRKIIKLYPEEPMFAVSMDQGSDAMFSYPEKLEQQMMKFCTDRILATINAERFFPCKA